MKFAFKLILSSILVLVIGFNVGTAIFIVGNFNYNLEYYIDISASNFYTQKYLIESKVATHIDKEQDLSSEQLIGIIDEINYFGVWNEYFVDVNYREENLFSSDEAVSEVIDIVGLSQTDKINYTIVEYENEQLLIFTSSVEINSDLLKLTIAENVSSVFLDGQRQLNSLVLINVAIIVFSCIVMAVLLRLITKRLNKLENATASIISGDFDIKLDEKGNDEISTLSKRFNLMSSTIKDSIEELDDYAKARDMFVADFSHELKTPLTSMIGYADFIRKEEWENPAVAEASQYIYSQSMRLQNLAQKMLELMEIKNRSSLDDINLQEFLLRPIFIDAIKTLKLNLKQKNIKIRFYCSGNIYVYCDKVLLQSLFVNILSNAIKASSEDSEIIILAKADVNEVYISIEDFGVGIDKVIINNITEEFFIADKSRKGENNGLGLSIAKEIASIHKTNLKFDSEIGRGTCVSLGLKGGVKIEKNSD